MSAPQSKSAFMDPPHYSTCGAYILFIINIFCPGIGTFIAGLCTCSCSTMIIGILQSLSAVIIVGWVWSILWGWELVQVSKS